MRFGLFVPQGWRLDLAGIDPAEQWEAMLGVARRAEEGPFESVWVYDHFHTVPEPTQEATHEAWTLMAAFAAATSRVRLGQMCTCMGYRHPMYLAKVAATVDVISGGRVEMGIGAGWYEHEWKAYGYGFPSAGERLAMLGEGVEIMRQAWTRRRGDVLGAALPGGRRDLPPRSAAARWTAAVGRRGWRAEDPAHRRTACRLHELRRHPRGLRAEVGGTGAALPGDRSRLGEIVRSANYNVVIGRDEAEVAQRLGWLREHYRPHVSPERLETAMQMFSSGPLVGTPEQIVETLQALQALGMTYAITYFADVAYDTDSLDLFTREVVPALA